MSTLRPLLVALLLFFVILAGVGITSLRRTGGDLIYPDDGYIGMATAKNLATHGVWGVTRFGFSGAATSLAWPVVLASAERTAGRHELTPFVLNVALAVAVLALAWAALSRYVTDRWWQTAALALLVGATPLPGLALLGMEHTLQCFAALAVALAAVRIDPADGLSLRRRRVAITAACAALAVATRYDTASVLIGALVVIAWASAWRHALVIALASAVPPAIYAAVAWRHDWPVLPVAVMQKGRLSEFGDTWSSGLGAAASGIAALADTPALAALVVGAIVLLAAPVAAERFNGERRRLLVVFLIAAILHVQFSRTGYPYRYEAYLIALGLLANVAALAGVVPRLSLRPALLWIPIVLAVSPMVMRAGRTNLQLADEGRRSYQHEYLQGLFLAKFPQDRPVMLVDLGAPAYFSDVRPVDLGGLGTLDVVGLTLDRSVWTAETMRRLAAAHDVQVAIDLQGGLPLPPEWRLVARWTSADLDLDFMVTDRSAGAGLVNDLRAFEAALPRAVKLHVFEDDP